MAYVTNVGELPWECIVRDENGKITGWRNVHVRLFGGYDSRKAGHPPWPADGARPATNWAISRRPHPFEIREWEVA